MYVRGWASVPAFFLAIFAGPMLGGVLAGLVDNVAAFPVGCLLGIPVTDLFGVLVNTRRRPGSRSWRDRISDDRHTVNDIPVEHLSLISGLLAVLASVWVTAETHTRFGWASYLIALATGVLVLGYFVVTRGFALWREWRQDRTRARERRDIGKTITLTRAEAASGTIKTIRYRVWRLCRECSGAGYRVGETRGCRACGGDGLGGRTRTKVTIKIPAGVGPGKRIRIAGRGTPAHLNLPAGDVFLVVHVRGLKPGTPKATTPPPRWAPPPPAPKPSADRPPSQQGPVTVETDNLQVIVARMGLTIINRRVSVGAKTWVTTTHLEWTNIREVAFSTGPNDPVVALYAIPNNGPRQHVLDANQLPDGDWRRIADAVYHVTSGRITLDLAARDR